MNDLMKEAIETTTKLNELYWKTTKDEFTIPFQCEISCNSWIDFTRITFNGMEVWNSETDDRVYVDEIEDYEPIMDHIKRWYVGYRKTILRFKL